MIRVRQRGAVAGGKGHIDVPGTIRVGATGAAGAVDGDDDITAVLIHSVICRREGKRAGTANGTAVDPGQIRVRHPIVVEEAATNDDFLIGHVRGITRNRVFLHDHRRHRAVRARAKVDGGIHRAVGVQARNPVAGHAIGLGKLAAHDDATVRLQSDAEHRIVRPEARRKGAVRRAVRAV